MTKWTDDKRVTVAFKDDWCIQIVIIHEEIAMPSSIVAYKSFKHEQEALDFIHAKQLEWANENNISDFKLQEFKSLAFISEVTMYDPDIGFYVAVDEATLNSKRTPDEQGHYWKWGEHYRETWLAPTTEALEYIVEEQYKNSPENIAGLEREAESLG